MPPELAPTALTEPYYIYLQRKAQNTIKNEVTESDQYKLREKIDSVLQFDPEPEGHFVDEDIGRGSPLYCYPVEGDYLYRVWYRVYKDEHKITVAFIEVCRFPQAGGRE